MDESRLRSVRGDVEAHVELPDFAVVASAAVAVTVAVVTLGAAHTSSAPCPQVMPCASPDPSTR